MKKQRFVSKLGGSSDKKETQQPVIKKKNSKTYKYTEIHYKTGVADKFCTVNMVLEIIFVVIMGGFALAPILSAFFGIAAFLSMIVAVVVCTTVSLGTVWLSQGFKDFQGWWWNLIGTAFNGGTQIKETLKGSIIWIMISFLLLCIIFFLHNLVYFIKEDKDNQGRFITSCVFLGLGVINLFLGLAVYLWIN